MNKAELVEKLTETTGFTKKDARTAVDGLVQVITKSLVANEPVIITGFGKFETRKRKATTRINPQTRQKMKTPAKTVPAFKAGKNLKEAVAKKGKERTGPPEREVHIVWLISHEHAGGEINSSPL